MAFKSNVTTQAGKGTVTTFSGSDIKTVFGNIEIGNIQGISWSVNREVRPIFVCGDPNALAYSKNKRGVAGSIVMTCFDRAALRDIMDLSKVYRTDQSFVPGNPFNVSNDNPFGDEKRVALYADEIPPFDITLYGKNEFGKQMVMRIFDVTLISEGAGMSIDDGIQEAQFTYVARHIDSWRPVAGVQSATADAVGIQSSASIT